MYGSMTKNAAHSLSDPYAASDVTGDPRPLSMEIMDRTNVALEQANAIVLRLWQYRDRVHGATPEPGNGANASQTDPGHFSAAWRLKFNALDDALNAIDRLSSEIVNRF